MRSSVQRQRQHIRIGIASALAVCVLWLAMPMPVAAQDPRLPPPEPDGWKPPVSATEDAFDNLVDHFVVGMRWTSESQLHPSQRGVPLWATGPMHIAWLRQMQAAFASLDARELDTARWIDYRLLESHIAGQLAAFDDERPDLHDPLSYLPEPDAIKRHLGRRAGRRELQRVLATAAQMTHQLTVARAGLLQPWVDRRPPTNRRIDDLRGQFRQATNHAGRVFARDRESRDAFQRSMDAAVRTLDDYRSFLVDHPGARERSAEERQQAQARNFARHVRYHHHIAETPAELWKLAQQQYEQIERQLEEAARVIGPRSWREIIREMKDNHPTDDEVQKILERSVARARDWLRENPIVPLPDKAFNLRVQVHRDDNAHAYAWYRPLEGNRPGVYNLALMTDKASPEARESRLRDLYRERLEVITVHECLPGHHLQFACMHGTERSLARRRLTFVPSYYEGWAVYCEKLQYELGFTRGPRAHLAMLKMRLWRAARMMIDIGINTLGMTQDEAVALLVDGILLEPPAAQQEVRRHAGRVGTAFSYLYGALQIEKLRTELEAELGSRFSLLDFHRRVLDDGMMPLRLLRARVLGERLPRLFDLPDAMPAFPREWVLGPCTPTPAPTAENQLRLPGHPGHNLGVGRLVVSDGTPQRALFARGIVIPPGAQLSVIGADGLVGFVRVGATPVATSAGPVRVPVTHSVGDGFRSGMRVCWGAGLPANGVADNAATLLLVRSSGDSVGAVIEVDAGIADADLTNRNLPVRDANGRQVGWFRAHTSLPWNAGDATRVVVGALTAMPPDARFAAGMRVEVARAATGEGPDDDGEPAVGRLVETLAIEDEEPPVPDAIAIAAASLPRVIGEARPDAMQPGAKWGVYDSLGRRMGWFVITEPPSPGADGEMLFAAGAILPDPARRVRARSFRLSLRVAWPAVERIHAERD